VNDGKNGTDEDDSMSIERRGDVAVGTVAAFVSISIDIHFYIYIYRRPNGYMDRAVEQERPEPPQAKCLILYCILMTHVSKIIFLLSFTHTYTKK
jgi:hypothetical protein